jgi:hypothetical protein
MKLTIAVELLNCLGLGLPNFKKYIVDDIMYVYVSDVANYIDAQISLREFKRTN